MVSIILWVTLVLGVTYNTCGVYIYDRLINTQYNILVNQVSLVVTLFQLHFPGIQSIR